MQRLTASLLACILIVLGIIAVEVRPRSQEVKPAPTRWDYVSFNVFPQNEYRFFHEYLSEFGAMGWELVTMNQVRSHSDYGDAVAFEVVFKRPLGIVGKEESLKEKSRMLEMMQGK